MRSFGDVWQNGTKTRNLLVNAQKYIWRNDQILGGQDYRKSIVTTWKIAIVRNQRNKLLNKLLVLAHKSFFYIISLNYIFLDIEFIKVVQIFRAVNVLWMINFKIQHCLFSNFSNSFICLMLITWSLTGDYFDNIGCMIILRTMLVQH